MEAVGSPITICLWFDGAAEEAAQFYTSLNPESSLGAGGRLGAWQQPSEENGDVY